jgi:2-dehydro-3-deoxyglucarate aldolase/4-hydroxy-2-oxoheptanedioate aldolase
MPEPAGRRKAIPFGHDGAMPDTQPPVAALPPRADLRRRVLAGEPTLGLWLNLGSLVAADIVARAGFDWVVLDLEHGLSSDPELLARLVAVQGTPTAALIRVVSGERMRVGRVLDLGADGLVIPRLETLESVRETLSWMRYPPAGIRGVAAGTRGAGYGSVPHAGIHAIDERILGVFQVESRLAVDASAALAATEGVDVLFVGPADLSHDMGIPGEFAHPDFLAALEQVASAAAAHGKAAGILLGDASEVPAYRARGFGFLGIGSDSGLLVRGARDQLTAARAGLG